MNEQGKQAHDKPDPVEEASKESFPASDSPGWISQRAEDLKTQDEAAMGWLKQLATSEVASVKVHYQTIDQRRDEAITQAVVAVAQAILQASDYSSANPVNLDYNKQQAVEAIEEYLARSNIAEIDQRLLALMGIHALYGLKVEITQEDGELRMTPTGNRELDPQIVIRLAKALDRSPDYEALLWEKINEVVEPPDDDLVKAAVKAALKDIPLTPAEDDMDEQEAKEHPGG